MNARTFLIYAVCSYGVAALLAFGFWLMVGGSWKPPLGVTIILGTLMFAWTLRELSEKFKLW